MVFVIVLCALCCAAVLCCCAVLCCAVLCCVVLCCAALCRAPPKRAKALSASHCIGRRSRPCTWCGVMWCLALRRRALSPHTAQHRPRSNDCFVTCTHSLTHSLALTAKHEGRCGGECWPPRASIESTPRSLPCAAYNPASLVPHHHKHPHFAFTIVFKYFHGHLHCFPHPYRSLCSGYAHSLIIHSFFHLFAHSSHAYSHPHSLTHSTHLLTHPSPTNPLHSLTHSRTHSLTHLLTHSRTHARTHARTQSLTHSPTHSLTYSINQSINQSLFARAPCPVRVRVRACGGG